MVQVGSEFGHLWRRLGNTVVYGPALPPGMDLDEIHGSKIATGTKTAEAGSDYWAERSSLYGIVAEYEDPSNFQSTPMAEAAIMCGAKRVLRLQTLAVGQVVINGSPVETSCGDGFPALPVHGQLELSISSLAEDAGCFHKLCWLVVVFSSLHGGQEGCRRRTGAELGDPASSGEAQEELVLVHQGTFLVCSKRILGMFSTCSRRILGVF